MKDYDCAKYKSEMAKVVNVIWSSNLGECPYNTTELNSFEWGEMYLEIPLIYFSHFGDANKYKGLSDIASAGVRIKQLAEAQQVVEMLVDVGLMTSTRINLPKGHPPIVECSIMFPSIDDLDDIGEENYRLLIGTCLLGWIKTYIMDAFRADLHQIASQTMMELSDMKDELSSHQQPIHSNIH